MNNASKECLQDYDHHLVFDFFIFLIFPQWTSKKGAHDCQIEEGTNKKRRKKTRKRKNNVPASLRTLFHYEHRKAFQSIFSLRTLKNLLLIVK